VGYFASGFNNTDTPCAALSPEFEDDCRNSDFSAVDTETVRGQFYHLNVYKSVEHNSIHPRVLKELVDVTARPIIYQRS